jgi:hypothetical protein
MKRFVWLALFAFGTALAQVQPVIPLQAQVEACCCCEDTTADACAQSKSQAMDDCLSCISCAPALSTLLPATAIAVAASPAEISRLKWLEEKGPHAHLPAAPDPAAPPGLNRPN